MKFSLVGESAEELDYRANLYNDTFHATLDELRRNEIERNYQGVENNLAEAKQRLARDRLQKRMPMHMLEHLPNNTSP